MADYMRPKFIVRIGIFFFFQIAITLIWLKLDFMYTALYYGLYGVFVFGVYFLGDFVLTDIPKYFKQKASRNQATKANSLQKEKKL